MRDKVEFVDIGDVFSYIHDMLDSIADCTAIRVLKK